MEELRDIKEIVMVDDNSLLLLIATIIVTLLLITVVGYLLSRKKRRRRLKPTPRESAQKVLQSIDYTNTKEAAYRFSENAYRFVTDETTEAYNKIDEALNMYKYKKEVPALDKTTTNAMRAFIKGIKWNS